MFVLFFFWWKHYRSRRPITGRDPAVERGEHTDLEEGHLRAGHPQPHRHDYRQHERDQHGPIPHRAAHIRGGDEAGSQQSSRCRNAVINFFMLLYYTFLSLFFFSFIPQHLRLLVRGNLIITINVKPRRDGVRSRPSRELIETEPVFLIQVHYCKKKGNIYIFVEISSRSF